ncbi:DUF4405 domain-containing protein [Parapedobacter sp. SGR-10]|jgi:hypothetical protein|uniref:DUF4405 domain-containing protein n=1 Tax=Parapedobacter sp. SGR-10 TaxID=2710879 RepID=UPI0013D58452|nr:DUF4405 domain-containing protein [Parapedobacter sp. SGR-10]NGF57254.1 DUF4405 domain-containing protein [Parapedobacter sp. SGR-10]
MKPNRNYVTPFISLLFVVVGLSGLLMFFHLFEGYTEVVHEVLGLFFTISAVFHILLNWKALKIHFKKAVFLPALFGVIMITSLLVVMERLYPPVDLQIMNRIIKAPVRDAFQALNINYEEANIKLKAKGIAIENAQSLEDLWKMNNADAEVIIDLLLE